MKIYKKLFSALPFLSLIVTSCTPINTNPDVPPEPIIPTDDPNQNPKSRNFYQLLVYSFADSNNDGIGDFKGIVDKLDYLVDLGVEGLWLSPVLKSKSYHAYDVLDYYEINNDYQYGDYDYHYLLDECHKRNIVVVMDLVLNHTSNNHVWKSQHSNWYSGQDAFPGGMSDLNYERDDVKQAIIDVGKYWLNQGFDGYRLDAAMWLYNTGSGMSGSIDHDKNYAYWTRWCNEMRSTKSSCYIIAEVLSNNHDFAYEYARGGFDSTFDFNVRRTVHSAVNGSNDYVEKTITNMNKAFIVNPNYILGRVLSNHDIGRFSQVHNGMDDEPAYYFTDFANLRLANALNIMMRGNTFIYYGDELGLKGTCPQGYDDMAFRTPMPFSSGRTDSVRYYKGFRGNGVTTSTTLSGKNADQDMNDKNSLYYTVKSLLNIKKNSDAIKNGTLDKITNLPNGLKGYALSNRKKTVSFIYNPSANAISYDISQKVLFATDTYTDKISISSKGFIVTSN